MTQEKQKKWDLIDKFNYEAIAAYMNAVGWKYRDKDVDAYDVKESALWALNRAIVLALENPDKEQYTALGGFHAEVEFHNGELWSMRLKFQHTEFA